MTYAVIDPVIKKWARRTGIPVSVEYKGEDVRSFEILGQKSQKHFQLWVDNPNSSGQTIVTAWDRKKWKISYSATPFNLMLTLDKALNEIIENDHISRVCE